MEWHEFWKYWLQGTIILVTLSAALIVVYETMLDSRRDNEEAAKEADRKRRLDNL